MNYFIDLYTKSGLKMGYISGDVQRDLIAQAQLIMPWLTTAEIKVLMGCSAT